MPSWFRFLEAHHSSPPMLFVTCLGFFGQWILLI
jgi:hypothetical protein